MAISRRLFATLAARPSVPLPTPVPPASVLQAARQEVQDKDILASQQEYRKGVSSWNFDVAALKAAAAAAREDEEDRLPPISEHSGAPPGWLAGQLGGWCAGWLGHGRGTG